MARASLAGHVSALVATLERQQRQGRRFSWEQGRLIGRACRHAARPRRNEAGTDATIDLVWLAEHVQELATMVEQSADAPGSLRWRLTRAGGA
ncbi:hypothetical protein [Streptomyces albipurpureus]|uniref:Uncharacterized protein n=1 Tax=Streptomyces albipurpureus TaxID=2897419 RepID=A0ABT0V2K8_9ACTN|nr:hypothetical protein [Streptomyces sp. CWNU-1]MCM2393626.1 hypothetical protein [Streptomyces sp. CWNU-1]